MPVKKKSAFNTGIEKRPKIDWLCVIVKVLIIATSLAPIKAPSSIRFKVVIPTNRKARNPIR